MCYDSEHYSITDGSLSTHHSTICANWKVIGTLLGLPSGELKAIEAGYATNVMWCCNQMLEKWLDVDTTASWGKLFTIIESPAVSISQVVDKSRGTYVA